MMNKAADNRPAGFRSLGRLSARSAVLVLIINSFAAGEEPKLQWSSDRQHRLVVRVDPIVTLSRASDELVASVEIDFEQQLGGRNCDASSLQVVGYEESGSPGLYAMNPLATAAGERPSRFYDASIPWDYPEGDGYAGVHNQDGSGKPIKRTPGGGRFMGVLGENRKGRVVWAHTQINQKPSYYAIYFSSRPEHAPPGIATPGFVGDGTNRCSPNSRHFFPSLIARVDLADLDDDGLFDLVVGEVTGKILWYKNRGRKNDPVFQHPQLLFGDDGNPLDIGYMSGPRCVDWDADGDLDLIVGAEKESVVFFRNIGSKSACKFHLEGLLQADNKAIVVPRVPCAEDRNGAMSTDYSPVPEVVDWDGDGDKDLLLGGFVTGMIWLYENIADKSALEPELTFRGPLQADGKDLDVTWMAAPCVADFDADGDLDLVSGAWQWEWGTGGKSDVTRFLMYYENTGTRTLPKLTHRYPFPARGQFSSSGSGTPRAIDFNGDGLPDLVVSTGSDLLLVPNVGQANAPSFNASVSALTAPWGNDALRFQQLVDYNADGWPDLFTGDTINVQQAPSPLSVDAVQPGDLQNKDRFSHSIPLLPKGGRIYHESERGDHWDYRALADLDGDGKMDILVGDNAGNVWFHRDIGEKGRPLVDEAGVRLRLTTGKLLSVFDPPSAADAHPHDDLQGARPTINAGDFNRDGRTDLVVCNTYGVIQLFLRSAADEVAFESAIAVARVQKIRLTAQTVDWNNDGWDDILATYAGGDTFVLVNRGQPGGVGFAEAKSIEVPQYWMSWPFVHVADWNHDGDQDLIFHNGIMMRFVERSFLEHGYVPATVLRVEHEGRSSAR